MCPRGQERPRGLHLWLKSLKIIYPAFQLVTEDPILNLCLCICVRLIIGFCNLVT